MSQTIGTGFEIETHFFDRSMPKSNPYTLSVRSEELQLTTSAKSDPGKGIHTIEAQVTDVKFIFRITDPCQLQ